VARVIFTETPRIRNWVSGVWVTGETGSGLTKRHPGRGFEAFHLFQRGVEGAAGGIDAVLEPAEGPVALLEGIGAPSRSCGLAVKRSSHRECST